MTDKTRKILRIVFTKSLEGLEALVNNEHPTIEEIRVNIEMLENKFSELAAADEKVFAELIDNEEKPEVVAKEVDEADEFKTKFIRIRNKVTLILTKNDAPDPGLPGNDKKTKTKTYKYPTIELKKFNGDVKEWLTFWSQFQKIHQNAEMMEEDKFQYLLQAMAPGTRAWELVSSFPPTAENYAKVIESLKNRFGRDELLVEVYVRELLKLVLQNALKPNEKIQLSTLYDKVESHLRSLETLGVTKDMCGAMLYPLVESSLPEEVLRAWQRSSLGGNSATATKKALIYISLTVRARRNQSHVLIIVVIRIYLLRRAY